MLWDQSFQRFPQRGSVHYRVSVAIEHHGDLLCIRKPDGATPVSNHNRRPTADRRFRHLTYTQFGAMRGNGVVEA
ncbi:hypothetical protein VTH82DRAFT_3100 [Thermothelomyces myriococcoides]